MTFGNKSFKKKIIINGIGCPYSGSRFILQQLLLTIPPDIYCLALLPLNNTKQRFIVKDNCKILYFDIKLWAKYLRPVMSVSSSFLVLIGYIYINFAGIQALLSAFIEYDRSQSAWMKLTGLNLFYYSIYMMTLYSKLNINLSSNIIVPEILGSLSGLYLSFILTLSFIVFIYSFFIKKISNINIYLIFGLAVPFSLIFAHVYYLGGVIPRIYIMWIWADVLMIVSFLEKRTYSDRVLIYSLVLILIFINNIIR